jgi:hypothetical protein
MIAMATMSYGGWYGHDGLLRHESCIFDALHQNLSCQSRMRRVHY